MLRDVLVGVYKVDTVDCQLRLPKKSLARIMTALEESRSPNSPELVIQLSAPFDAIR